MRGARAGRAQHGVAGSPAPEGALARAGPPPLMRRLAKASKRRPWPAPPSSAPTARAPAAPGDEGMGGGRPRRLAGPRKVRVGPSGKKKTRRPRTSVRAAAHGARAPPSCLLGGTKRRWGQHARLLLRVGNAVRCVAGGGTLCCGWGAPCCGWGAPCCGWGTPCCGWGTPCACSPRRETTRRARCARAPPSPRNDPGPVCACSPRRETIPPGTSFVPPTIAPRTAHSAFWGCWRPCKPRQALPSRHKSPAVSKWQSVLRNGSRCSNSTDPTCRGRHLDQFGGLNEDFGGAHTFLIFQIISAWVRGSRHARFTRI